MKVGVVVLDTLRYDTAVEEMSGIWKRADRIFSSMYSTSRWTTPAHASLFTGYYPTEVGTHADNKHLVTPQPTLAERFSKEGFETVAFTENVNIDRFFDFDRGFQRFHRSPGLSERPEDNQGDFDWQKLEAEIPESGLKRPLAAASRIVKSDAPTLKTLSTGLEMFLSQAEDEDTIDWALNKIQKLSDDPPEDLFLFANFMSCHFPYQPPAEYASAKPLNVQPLELSVRSEPVSESENQRQRDCYRGCVQYLDDALPAIINAFEWDLLFILSDHGELFGEYGLWGHQYGMYEELTHVPAVAIGNAVPQGDVDVPTSILDVHRTLLEAAGVSMEPSVRGVNILAESPDREHSVYAESVRSEWYSPDATGIEAKVPSTWGGEHYMIRAGEGMLIVDKDGTWTVDPESGEQLTETAKCKLRTEVEEIRANRHEFTDNPDTPAEVPAHIEKRLKSLGYR